MKPMKTAPKNGDEILAYDGDMWHIITWCKPNESDLRRGCWIDRDLFEIIPQGWIELPPPVYTPHQLWLLENVKDWQKGAGKVWRMDRGLGYSFSKPESKQSVGLEFITKDQWEEDQQTEFFCSSL